MGPIGSASARRGHFPRARKTPDYNRNPDTEKADRAVPVRKRQI